MRRFNFFNFFTFFTLLSILICAGHFFILFTIGWSLIDQLTFVQRAPTIVTKGKFST